MAAAHAQNDTPAWRGEHYTVAAVADGVFVAQPTISGAAGANATLIDLGDRTLVVDAGLTTAAGRDLIEAARRLTGRAPALLALTHHHSDHAWGSAAFVDAAHPPAGTLAGTPGGVERIASAGTRQLLLTATAAEAAWYREQAPREVARLDRELARTHDAARRARLEAGRRFYAAALDAQAHAPATLATWLPTITYDRQLVIHGARRLVELRTYGGGHTHSDSVVRVPDVDLLVAGDLVTVEAHPWLGDGDAHEWLHILQMLQTQPPACIVPGHGPPAGAEALDVQARYIQHILEQATTHALTLAALEDADALEETAQAGDATDPAAPETHLWPAGVEQPAAYATWAFGSFYALNLQHEADRLLDGRRRIPS